MITVFTPTHDARMLTKAAQSLEAQYGIDFRWVVLLNGDAKHEHVPTVPGVKVIVRQSATTGNVGALKREACQIAIDNDATCLVELDHDDELEFGALRRVSGALETSGFVYSDTYCDQAFDARYGWQPYATESRLGEGTFWVNPTPDVSARSLCEIYYAPNHLRAWTADAYRQSGGYDDQPVCDDQDLLIRTYLAGVTMTRIPEPLYIQRSHPSQTQLLRNAEIQTKQAEIRDRYTERLALEEARRTGTLAIDLGGLGGEGYKSLNILPGSDYKHDVEDDRLPFEDNSVGVFRASDFLEHIRPARVIHAMNEIYRCLKPGGWLLTDTPSTDGRGAFQDPTHVSFWNSNSWWYYTRAEQRRYVPQIRAKFQMVSLRNHNPTAFHELHNIVYCTANMVALKNQPQIGEILV